MLSNQIIINCLAKIRENTGETVEVYSPAELLITETGTRHYPEVKSLIRKLDATDVSAVDGKCYFRVEELGRLQYLVAVPDTPVGQAVGKMAVLQLETLLNMERGVMVYILLMEVVELMDIIIIVQGQVIGHTPILQFRL